MNNLLLLHGALGAKSQFAELEKKLTADFQVHKINFSGHGGKPVPVQPFSMKLFAEDILHYLDENRIDKIDIFGYSTGGYAAIYLARHYPERAGKIFTIATKFLWNEEISEREIKMLNYEKMKEKVPEFISGLEERHSPQDLKIILSKTADMLIKLGKNNELKSEDYALINHDIMVGLGDRDKMVTIEETVNVYSRLPNGRLIVLPDTPHPLEAIDTEKLAGEMRGFFKDEKRI